METELESPSTRGVAMSPTSPRSKLLRVLVCGGGNAAHVFAGSLAARGHLPTLLTTYPKEADAIRKGCEANAGMEIRGWTTRGASTQTIRGKPVAIVGSFEEAFCLASRSTRHVRYDLVRPSTTPTVHAAVRGAPPPRLARTLARAHPSRWISFHTARARLPRDTILTICRPAVSSHPPQVLLAIPAPYHDAYLAQLAPYLRQSAEADASHASHALADAPARLPTILAAAVAQGGFDMAARAALADAGEFRGEVVVAGFETLPWACRVARPGAVAEVLGTKDTVDAAVAVFPGTSENLDVYAKPVLQTLQIAVGPVPEVRLASGFLGITLMNINAFWHPTLLWHRWRDWDGTPVEGPPPLLYETAPDDLACDAMSAEIAAVVAAIRARYPPGALVDDMSSARPVRSWFLDSYGHDPNLDKTSTATMMRTNPAYRGLTHPMRPVERKKNGDVSSRDSENSADPGAKLLVPDFSHRYVAEDVGYGLAVMRGVAELAGVPTPTVDAVIVWAQKQAGLSFLIERKIDKPGGELSHPAADEPGSPGSPGAEPKAASEPFSPRLICAGADLTETRCPQRFGWFDLRWFMQSNGYARAERADDERG